MKKLQRIELLKDFIQEAVDRGATSVQAIHEYIADLPFEALEQTGLIKHDRISLREKQQQTIGMVYGAIRRINRDIGQLISDQFENVEETETVIERMVPERAASPATAAPAKKTSVRKAVGKTAKKAGGSAPRKK